MTYDIHILRKKIDQIDMQLVELLLARWMYSNKIMDLKIQLDLDIFDPLREEEIIKNVRDSTPNVLDKDRLEEFFRLIFKLGKLGRQ